MRILPGSDVTRQKLRGWLAFSVPTARKAAGPDQEQTESPRDDQDVSKAGRPARKIRPPK